MEDDSIATLFTENYDRLIKWCVYKLGKNRELAQDIVSDCFLRFVKYSKRNMIIDHPKAFLNRIVSNAIIDEYRKKKPTSLEALIELSEYSFEPSDDSSYKKIIAKAELKTILPFVSSLPESFRQVLILRYIKGLTLTEISNALNISTNAVGVRINRARILLLKAVSKRSREVRNNRKLL